MSSSVTPRSVTPGSLDHLALYAADVEALAAAYVGVLGAVVVEEAYPGWCRMHLANVDVIVWRGDPGLAVLAAFRIQDVEAFRDALAASAFQVETVEDARGAVVLTFRDPAGNRLQAVRWGGRVEDLVQ